MGLIVAALFYGRSAAVTGGGGGWDGCVVGWRGTLCVHKYIRTFVVSCRSRSTCSKYISFLRPGFERVELLKIFRHIS